MDRDRMVALLAERQHGLVTRPQALRLGLSASGIDRRLALGTLERLYDGVYRLTGSPRSWEQTAVAACLAAGRGTVVSHRCAARVLSMPGAQNGIEIIVLQSRRIELAEVTVHRAARLDSADRMRSKQVPVTSVARTLIDLAGILEGDELEAVLDHVLGNRRVPLAYLQSRLAALGTRGRKGAGVLAELLTARATVVRVLQSNLERELRSALAEAGLPEPESQHPIRLPGGGMTYPDFAYPGAMLAIEADSYVHHSTLTDWCRDHARNSELVALGWRILPVTYRELEENPAVVADRVRRALTAVEVRRNSTA